MTYVDGYKEYMLKQIENSVMAESEKARLKHASDEYAPFILKKEDYYVKKEMPFVEEADRCIGIRSSDKSRCIRRKRFGEYCGIHIKFANQSETQECDGAAADAQQKPAAAAPQSRQNSDTTKFELCVEIINGIAYYVDRNNVVYDTEDVENSIVPPRILGHIQDGRVYIAAPAPAPAPTTTADETK